MFAQCHKDARLPFAELLTAAAKDPSFRVIVTLRTDYASAMGELTPIQTLLQEETVLFFAPGLSALNEMIRRPAERSGIALDDGLVDAILAEVRDVAGALPLVAFCLRQLYEIAAEYERLTTVEYEKIGRLRGAIGRHAGAVIKQLTHKYGAEEVDSVLPILFDGLVTVDAVGTPTTRRTAKEALSGKPVIRELVDELVSNRLLLATGNENHPSIEIAHEALFSGWPALEGWIERNRENLISLTNLLGDAARWEKSDRDNTYLLLGKRLDDARELYNRYTDRLNDAVREYIEASGIYNITDYRELVERTEMRQR